MLQHYGVKGMKWGVRKDQKSPVKMSHVKYRQFDKFGGSDMVRKRGEGSCHEQTAYAIEQLRKKGYDAHGKFFIDVDKNGQGYQTHTFAYWNDPVRKKTYWLQNAWQDQKGIHQYSSQKQMIRDIKKRVNAPKGITTVFGKFEPSQHKIGQDLQQLVDICLR